MNKTLLQLLCLCTFILTRGFTPNFQVAQKNDRTILSATSYDDLIDSDPSNDNTAEQQQSWKRRQLFYCAGSLALAPLLAPKPAFSETTATEESSGAAINAALQDLPPIPTDFGRIFFCRHGQTENNRLRLVQGSRVNVGINTLGEQQGRRVGLALAATDPSPSLIYYSPLIRAKQTAEQANQAAGSKLVGGLDSLKEVDFGPVAEGQLVAEAKPGMMATYARWSMGNVDFRPEGGGDSARDVLSRAAAAVNTLTKAAGSDECPNRCIAAFTHSTYLRMLLALFLGDTLAQGANLKTANGSINVIDVNLKGETTTIGPKSKLVGGFLSQAPRNFRLAIPVANVVRVNEIRHLEGL